jgi:hypothetical protein
LLLDRLGHQFFERWFTDDGHGPSGGGSRGTACGLRVHDQEVDPCVIELMPDFGWSVGGIDRRQRRTGQRDRVEHHGELGAVTGHERHRAARSDAPFDETACEPSHAIEQPTARPHRSIDTIDDRHVVCTIGRGAEGVVRDRHVGDVDVGQRTTHDERRRCGGVARG